MPGFKHSSRPVQPNDPVASSLTNRLGQDGFDNTVYLLSLLRAAQLGEALVLRGRHIAGETLIGQPVYYDADNQRFAPALAGVAVNDDLQTLELTAASQVWGVLIDKTDINTGDILVAGASPLDLTEAGITHPAPAGLYYLSSAVAGQLAATPPSIEIPVLRADGAGNVLVSPRWSSLAHDHTHYAFDLVCEPAGALTPPDVDDPHTIDTPDSGLTGWLPADDAVFEGHAPVGAVWGYNLSQHPELAAVWPPVPLGGTVLLWTQTNGSDLHTVEVPPDLVQLDAFGIWWLTDCYGQVPWPVDFDDDDSSASVAPDECPIVPPMRLRLYFAQPMLGTAGAVVTSLRAAEDSDLIVRCATTGDPATTGALEIDLNLDLESDVEDAEGHLVFKTLNGNTFDKGPVVEGVIAGSDRVIISSTDSREAGGETIHQGIITLDLDTDPASRELPTTVVRMQGVNEDFPFDVVGLSFAPARTSSFRGRIDIPGAGLPASPKLRIRLRLLGKTAGDLPEFELYYRIIPASTTPVALPTVDDVSALPDLPLSVTSYQYVDILSDPIPADPDYIQPGDQVLYELRRLSTDSYAGEVVALQYVGVLESDA